MYEESTAPVVRYYEKKGNMLTINSVGAIEEVFERLLKAIGL